MPDFAGGMTYEFYGIEGSRSVPSDELSSRSSLPRVSGPGWACPAPLEKVRCLIQNSIPRSALIQISPATRSRSNCRSKVAMILPPAIYGSRRASNLDWPSAPVTPDSLIQKIHDSRRQPENYLGTIDATTTKLAQAVGPRYPLYGVRFVLVLLLRDNSDRFDHDLSCHVILRLRGEDSLPYHEFSVNSYWLRKIASNSQRRWPDTVGRSH